MLRKVAKDPLSGDNSSSSTTSAHMCLSFNKTNRIRLIVGSSDIRYFYHSFPTFLCYVFKAKNLIRRKSILCIYSEEKELVLTTTINEIIKLRWVALGPRNYGKSIEWKLEGDPWDTEGKNTFLEYYLYSSSI